MQSGSQQRARDLGRTVGEIFLRVVDFATLGTDL